MLQTTGYNPNFFTTKLRAILDGANISPDSVIKVKSGDRVRIVSPLGHAQGSMAAAIDFCILRGITDPASIIKELDNDPTIAEQRKKFLKTKDEINTTDLLAKIDGHFQYYCRKNFDSFFTRTFQTNPAVVRSIRKAAMAYRENTWKPGLKKYKMALEQACINVANEITTTEDIAPEKRVCSALTKAGLPCKSLVQGHGDTCRVHTIKE